LACSNQYQIGSDLHEEKEKSVRYQIQSRSQVVQKLRCNVQRPGKTAPTKSYPIKAKFSSSKNRLSFTFAAPDTRGLRHEKSSCISLTLKNCESPSSWRSLSNTWQFSLQSHEAQLTVGKAQNLGRQANEKA
jgi:hypothetical protein